MIIRQWVKYVFSYIAPTLLIKDVSGQTCVSVNIPVFVSCSESVLYRLSVLIIMFLILLYPLLGPASYKIACFSTLFRD